MYFSKNYPFKSQAMKKEYSEFYFKQETDTWPVPFIRKIVTTDYGPTYVRICGPIDAPPLVLLHGITATSLMWTPNIAKWSKGYRVYAIDTINDYGLSCNSRPILQKSDFMKWLDSFFAATGLTSNINLLGMSYGGWLAGEYTYYHPDRIKKLVMLAPGATVLPMEFTFLRKSALSVLFPQHYSKELFDYLFADGLAHPENCEITMDCFIKSFKMGVRCFKKRWFVKLSVLSDNQLQELSNIPTLFIVGENEKLYSAAEALNRLHTVSPNINTALISGAGHDLTVVQAKLVNDYVYNFLQDN